MRAHEGLAGRPAVLVFAGLDPSGGAGIAADIESVAANGGHALPIVTALTVQDQNRVHEVHCVDAALIERQALALLDAVDIHAVKIGIPGSAANAAAIARVLALARARQPHLPVVLDPVLASGAGDRLSVEYATSWLHILLPLATVATPNLLEYEQADFHAVPHVLLTGGHGGGTTVRNRWLCADGGRTWSWPRLPGEFHGSGCTLAAAIAARLARGQPLEAALHAAQAYTHRALAKADALGQGQRIPRRITPTEQGQTCKDCISSPPTGTTPAACWTGPLRR